MLLHCYWCELLVASYQGCHCQTWLNLWLVNAIRALTQSTCFHPALPCASSCSVGDIQSATFSLFKNTLIHNHCCLACTISVHSSAYRWDSGPLNWNLCGGLPCRCRHSSTNLFQDIPVLALCSPDSILTQAVETVKCAVILNKLFGCTVDIIIKLNTFSNLISY